MSSYQLEMSEVTLTSRSLSSEGRALMERGAVGEDARRAAHRNVGDDGGGGDDNEGDDDAIRGRQRRRGRGGDGERRSSA